MTPTQTFSPSILQTLAGEVFRANLCGLQELDPQGYTKHYYAESERIASRIGNGGLACIDTPLVALSTYTSKLNTNSDYMDTVAQNRLSAPNYITAHLLDTLCKHPLFVALPKFRTASETEKNVILHL